MLITSIVFPFRMSALIKSKVNFETVGSKTYLNDVLVESDCVVVDTRKGAGVNFDATTTSRRL